MRGSADWHENLALVFFQQFSVKHLHNLYSPFYSGSSLVTFPLVSLPRRHLGSLGISSLALKLVSNAWLPGCKQVLVQKAAKSLQSLSSSQKSMGMSFHGTATL